jgi:pimeloyl-ACP methyl ester carboxylesterase
MKQAAEGRELVTLEVDGVSICGAYHRPPCDSDAGGHSRLGVMFLNGLYATRSANGDAAVFWADSFAKRGYHAFRIDLPGNGDSAGDPPAELLRFIEKGGDAPVAAAVMKKLVTHFMLSGMILVGHCAGAVSAIYAGAMARECCGLVLMDPYFHLPRPAKSKLRQKLHSWNMQSKVGGFLRDGFQYVKDLPRLLQRNAPPENANVALLQRWKALTARNVPVLVLQVRRRVVSGEFDYIEYIRNLGGTKSRLTLRIAEQSNHSFANRAGKAAVQQHAESWLQGNFPRHEMRNTNTNSACSESAGNELSIRIASSV